MTKNSLKLFIIFILTIFLTIPSNAQAAACDFPLSGNTTISTDCAITADQVMGVDDSGNDETATTNAAILDLDVSADITITSGVSGTTTLAVGSLTITNGSIIMGSSNAQIKLDQPIYFTDTDGDGWGNDFTYSLATASGKRRRSLMKSISLADCDDADANTAGGDLNTYYQDLDGDTYGNSSVSSSACSPPADYVSNNTDCYDADPASTNAELAYPSSATCSSNDRGDGSYDYDCDSSDTKCGTIYDRSCTTTSNATFSCGGMAPDKYCKNQTTLSYNSAGSFACGVVGCIGTVNVQLKKGCSSDGNSCSWSWTPGRWITVDTGPQTCQ